MIEPQVGESRNTNDDATMSAKPTVFRHEDVLALIAEVESRLSNMRETVREQSEDDVSLVRENARLEREISILEEERARVLERQCALESQLAALRASHAEVETRVETLCTASEHWKHEAERMEAACERTLAESRDARAALSNELMLEFERRAAEHERRAAEHERRAGDYERQAAEMADALEAARADALALASEVERLEKHVGTLTEERTQLEAQLESAQVSQSADTSACDSPNSSDGFATIAQPAPQLDEEEIARAAEARIHQLMAPKVAQLAQAAAFLRKRKERLAALRKGLRHRARALRSLKQIYAQPRLDAGTSEGSAVDSFAAHATPYNGEFAGAGEGLGANSMAATTGSAGALAAEREALASERQELLDLRTVLAASERALERRAQGTRLVTTSAAASIALAAAAFVSWNLAGSVFPEKSRATVELVASSRAPEAKQDGTVDAKSLADEVTAALTTDAFVGAVAGRISDRGRTHAEASTLAADLSSRVTLAQEGSTIRLSLQGGDTDDTIATLDAVATAAMAELNRRPERRNDLLRVGIANARQEVGRTVFSHAETIADPARIWRAGAILGGFAVLATLAAGAMVWLSRRAAPTDVA
ncbi:MAG: hypothetical protein RIR10_477 [Planctomycetota bacterium]|jgi:hypothetical protein